MLPQVLEGVGQAAQAAECALEEAQRALLEAQEACGAADTAMQQAAEGAPGDEGRQHVASEVTEEAADLDLNLMLVLCGMARLIYVYVVLSSALTGYHS